MIAGTYLVSAVMLTGSRSSSRAATRRCDELSDWGITLALAGTFFFASAGASAAYLTVSEIFPLEVRALAIAFFYAVGTAIGGITGPQVFEQLGSENTDGVVTAYLIGAAVMAFGGIVEIFLGVRAEQQELEKIAKPITAEEAEREKPAEEPERRRPRLRLGPGTSYSPFLGSPAHERPEWLDREIGIIGRALAEQGEVGREELARTVGARYWGPGRFRRALREAVARGVARRAGRGFASGPNAPQPQQ